MELALLVPVKDLSAAKTRLANLLTPAERRELAMLMLRGVLAEAGPLEGLARRVMVTNYRPAMELAEEAGFEVLREERQVSESLSVDWASQKLEAEGVGGVLRLPLDLPLVRRAEVADILGLVRGGAQAVLVPSMAGTGTNAIFRSPPTLFASRFGPGSLAQHSRLAREKGVQPELLHLPGLGLDVDEPADLHALLEREQDCPASEFLRERGVVGRLAALATKPSRGQNR